MIEPVAVKVMDKNAGAELFDFYLLKVNWLKTRE